MPPEPITPSSTDVTEITKQWANISVASDNTTELNQTLTLIQERFRDLNRDLQDLEKTGEASGVRWERLRTQLEAAGKASDNFTKYLSNIEKASASFGKLATSLSTSLRLPGGAGLSSLASMAAGKLATKMPGLGAMLPGIGMGAGMGLEVFKAITEFTADINRSMVGAAVATGRVGQGLQDSAIFASTLNKQVRDVSAEFNLSAKMSAEMLGKITSMGVPINLVAVAGERWQKTFLALSQGAGITESTIQTMGSYLVQTVGPSVEKVRSEFGKMLELSGRLNMSHEEFFRTTQSIATTYSWFKTTATGVGELMIRLKGLGVPTAALGPMAQAMMGVPGRMPLGLATLFRGGLGGAFGAKYMAPPETMGLGMMGQMGGMFGAQRLSPGASETQRKAWLNANQGLLVFAESMGMTKEVLAAFGVTANDARVTQDKANQSIVDMAEEQAKAYGKLLPPLEKVALFFERLITLFAAGGFWNAIAGAQGAAAIASKQSGGQINETGLYKLHEGEYVSPAGSHGGVNVTVGSPQITVDLGNLRQTLNREFSNVESKIINTVQDAWNRRS